MDAFGRAVSYGLQYGVPLKAYAKGMINLSFAPSGITDDEEVATANSIMDYIFKRLARDYLSFDDRLELGLASIDDVDLDDQASLLDVPADTNTSQQSAEDPGVKAEATAAALAKAQDEVRTQKLEDTDQHQHKPSDKPANNLIDPNAPLCSSCGNLTQRSGSCYVCPACGSTTGCS
jgi:ribonucleoside-diphosphate reductase alpha chain